MALGQVRMPPGLAGLLAAQEQVRGQEMDELRQAAAAQGLQAHIEQRQAAKAAAAKQAALEMEIAALPPEQRTRENVGQILMKYGAVKEATSLLPKAPEPQPIGAGGLRLPSGEVVAPAARPDTTPKKPITRERMAGTDTIQEELQPDGTWKQIGRGPRFAPPQPKEPKVPEPKDDRLTPENAGKVAMAKQSVEALGTARNIIFDKNGNLNRAIVGGINLPVVAGLPGNSQVRIARSALRNAVEAKLRLETGAAATESEVERTLARFMPTVADTAESAKFKLDELEKFFKSSLSMTKMPAGGAAPSGAKRLRFDAQGNPVP